MSNVKTWSTTAASNNATPPDGFPENMLPSQVNNAARTLMAEIREVWNDKEWFELGSGSGTSNATRASTTSITIAADVTSTYHVGRRVKIFGANTGTIYGKIATTSYSAPNTTVSFTLDSGTIHSSDTTPRVWVGSTYVGPATPVVDEDNMASNSSILAPSQQSVKAFVENLVTGQDLDVSDGSTAIAIDLDSETLGLLGGTGITSTASGNNVTLAIDGTVVTESSTDTLTNKTLTAPVISSISNTGTLTLPTSTDTLVGRATTDTLTNKTITGSKLKGTTQIEIGDTLEIYDGDIDFQGGTLKLDGSSPKGGTGSFNTALGEQALRQMPTSGSGTNNNNTAIGYATLRNTQNGGQNTGIGSLALNSLTGTAGNNTAVGYEAGKFISSGQNNTILGSFDGNESSLDIRTSSGNIVIADGNANIRFYANSSGNVGIGTVSPSSKLHINGDITADNGKITVSDGSSSTAINLGGTLTFDSNNFNESSGTVSVKTAGIGNTQVATGIASTKIADGSVSDTEFQYINSLSSNAQDQLTAKLVKASNLSDVASASTSRTNLGLGSISTQNANAVSVLGGSITGMGTPSGNTDVANKSYVDQAIAGLRNRTVAECASTANVNISNALEAGDTIDGVTLVAGDRVLLKNQSTATENGLYLAVGSGAGAASRDPEHDTIAELSGGMITVNQGSANDNKIFLCTTDSSGSIGSTNIVYTQITPSNTGTVESVGITQSGSEFTIGNTPITSTGNITLNVNRISATKIGANTNISDTEYGYLNGVTSNIQTQLDNSASLGDAISFAVALGS